jgi:hypothetical protein
MVSRAVIRRGAIQLKQKITLAGTATSVLFRGEPSLRGYGGLAEWSTLQDKGYPYDSVWSKRGKSLACGVPQLLRQSSGSHCSEITL